MRVVRIVAIVAGAFLALIIIAIIALLVFVDPNRYRGDIERVAHEHTARVLEIRGKMQLKVFPWLALSVHDVRLSNRPGFGTDPFMTVQNASIGVRVLPLLSGRVEVSKIALEGVHLNLVSRGEENNWKDLGESDEAPETPSPAPPPEPTRSSTGFLSIEGVDLSKSALVYRDEVKKSTTEIANVELHTGRLEAGPGRTAVGSLELQGTYVARAIPQTTSPDTKEELKPLAFSLSTTGVDISAQALAPAKIELKVGDSALMISLSGEKMSSDASLVTGTLALPSTSPRKLLQSLGIAPPITRDPKALSAVGLQTNFRLTHHQLQLSALQLTLDDTHIQGVAGVDDLDHPAVSFDLTVNAINVDRYRAPAQKSAAGSTPPPAQPPTPLPLETLRKLNVHGILKVGSATFSNLQLTDLLIPLTAQDGHIRLGPTQAHLYGGSCNGDIVLNAEPAQAQLSLTQHVHGTDTGALVKAAFDSARLTGRADLNVAMTGTGNTDDALIRSLNGKIDADVKQGALIGIDIVYELQRVNALVKRQVPPQRTGPARTVFNALQTNGTLEKGMLHIDELRIETDFLKVHGRGTLDTVTEAINYQLVASVNKLQPTGNPAGGNPAGEAGGGLDALKSVEVPLAITGTLSRPTVRPDIEALAKGKLGQEVKQQAVDQVKKKLGDKLKDLLGR